MRVLLVGGNSALARVLRPTLAAFAEVVTAGRAGCDMPLDLSDPKLTVPDGVDVVVNAAAHFGGADSEAFLAAETVNTIGSLKLCIAARQAAVKQIVHISSTSACLGSDSPYYGIYALSKRQADEVVQLFCTMSCLPCAILRPSQLYGDHDEFRRHQPFLYTALDRVLCGDNIVIYGRRGALRNYLHAEDFSRTIAAVIQKRIEGVYQCTNPVDVRLETVAGLLIASSGATCSVEYDTSKEDIPDNVFPYDDAVYRETGVFPEVGIEDGLARMVAAKMGTL